MAEKLKEIAGYDPAGRAEMKRTVIRSVTDRGGEDLANYMLGIYEKAMKERQRQDGERHHTDV